MADRRSDQASPDAAAGRTLLTLPVPAHRPTVRTIEQTHMGPLAAAHAAPTRGHQGLDGTTSRDVTAGGTWVSARAYTR